MNLKTCTFKIALVLGMAVFLFFQGVQSASAQSFEWYIPSFDVDIEVLQDSTLNVRERIAVQFEERRHGIFRDIPLEYLNNLGLNYNLRLDVKSVTQADGTPWNYEVSKNGRNLRIRIGDANIWVQGRQDYVINYSVQKGIRSFDEHDELYWNVTGNEWGVPIESASLTVDYPRTDADKIAINCFTGYLYSQEQNCTKEHGSAAAFFSTSGLLPGQGLTAAVMFPKGLLSPPSAFLGVYWFLLDNWGFLIPVFAFLILFYLWWTRGRDPKKYHTIVVEFSAPDDLSPAEMGTLFDESADMRDISSEIVQLAVNKHILIEEKTTKAWIFSGTDYVLKKRKDKVPKKPLNDHQKLIMKGIFGDSDTKKISELKYKFYSVIPDLKDALYDEVVKTRKYFPKHPEKLRKRYFIFGSVILFLSINSFAFFVISERLDILFGTLLLGPVIMLMARIMPRKTLKGSEAYRKILGFRDYIATAEKYRVKFQEDENIFERFLPYAMVFGLADKWADAFKGIYKGQPDWYKGEGVFVPNVFVGHLDNFARAANSSLGSKPGGKGSSGSSAFSGGSFGGGFSGGGFGGGGGGSW